MTVCSKKKKKIVPVQVQIVTRFFIPFFGMKVLNIFLKNSIDFSSKIQ
jgi:hypothetical protein